ncbi:MAG: hypothetical protein H0T90_06935 [Gemmatimonadales bacterium]|nr:hypothetical protein [Gemmatimonadales bacterium]
MLWSSILAASILSGPGQAGPAPKVTVTVDSSRKELTITAGPFHLANMPPREDHGMMDLGTSHDTPIQQFEWPVEGWFRGFRMDLTDAAGRPVPRDVIHHMIMVNFSRRQLLYSAAERLMGAGTETEDIIVPKSIGVPMKPGMRLGMYVAWHNDTGKDLEGVHLKLTMLWTPKNQNPPPVNSLPIYMDVNLTVGGTNTFDIPPGKSEKAYEFSLPVGGRLLGIGGHMHDYGVRVRLEEAESGKVLTTTEAKHDSAGKLAGMSRRLFGVTGDGLELKANRKYRVVGEYDNPTGKTLVKGAMAHMAGLFAPDDMDRWPTIDPRSPEYQRDMASLQVRGDRGRDPGGHAAGHTGH